MVMNKNMQIAVIKKAIRGKGIDADLIDLEAYVDGRLTLEENMHDIMDSLQFIVPIENKEKAPTQDVKKYDRYDKAQILQKLRSIRSQRRDGRYIARNNFQIQDLNKKNFKRWKKHPNRYDIAGVDNDTPAY